MAPTSTSSKRPAASSDFKRIKAKVGKRAPKPANYTDTSFQKASLHLASQQQSSSSSLQATTSGDVRSSQGRSLTSLSQQLGHSTTSIRQSAAKGILDIVSQKHRQDRPWTVHLAVVLPACGQCLVDTETAVRTTGLHIWQHVLEHTTETSLQPFWNVFCAFVASAMNALDRRVRRDSRLVVASASRWVPSLVAPHVGRLLPALLRMGEDVTFQYHTQVASTSMMMMDSSSSSKRNKNGRQVWLETLVALLQTLANENDGRDDSGGESNVWNFTTGNVSKNSLFVARPQTSTVRLLLMRQWWLESAGLGDATQPSASSSPSLLGRGVTQSLSEALATEVWSRLRDLLVEVLDANNPHETLAVWAEAVQALLEAADTPAECERLVVQVQGMVLAHEPSPTFRGTWMLTLTRLSQALPESLVDGSRRTSWVPRVVAYVLDKSDDSNDANLNNNNKEQQAAYWKLLRHLLDDPDVLKSRPGRKVLTHLIQNWDERNLPLFPQVYSVASAPECQRILQCMMNFCVEAGTAKDEKIIAKAYEFILDKIRDPRAVPDDLLDRFLPIWEKEMIAEYKLESTQRLAASLFMNLVGETRIANHISILSRLCAGPALGTNPSVAPCVVAFIQDSVFDLRRHLPLPKFLGFLMDGTGFTSVGKASIENDVHLQTASTYLLGCGVPNEKVLKMLWPLWLSWIEASGLFTKRAALAFLAILATDNASQSFLYENLPSEAHRTLLQAIVSVVQHQEKSLISQKWFQPVMTLLRYESWLWEPLLQLVAEDLSTVETVLIYNLREMIRDILPLALVEQPLLVGIQRGSDRLEEAAQDGPLRAATRELSDCIRAIAATVPLSHEVASSSSQT